MRGSSLDLPTRRAVFIVFDDTPMAASSSLMRSDSFQFFAARAASRAEISVSTIFVHRTTLKLAVSQEVFIHASTTTMFKAIG